MCGDPNHWAQDCPQRGGDGGAARRAAREGERAAAREAAVAARRGPSRRRKFEAPRLRAALGDLRREVPDVFRGGCPGGAVPRGGEARALRRLLELYQRWQHKAFLEWGFPEFVGQLERVGRKAEFRAMQNAVREEVNDRYYEAHPQLGAYPGSGAAGGPPATPSNEGGAHWQVLDAGQAMDDEAVARAMLAEQLHSDSEGAPAGEDGAVPGGVEGPESDLEEADLNDLLAAPTQECGPAALDGSHSGRGDEAAPGGGGAPGGEEASQPQPWPETQTQTQPGEDLGEEDIQDLLGEESL